MPLTADDQKWIEDRLDAHDAYVLANLKATLPGLVAAKIPAGSSTPVDVNALADAVAAKFTTHNIDILGKA